MSACAYVSFCSAFEPAYGQPKIDQMVVKRCRGSAHDGTLREVVSLRISAPAAQAWRAAPSHFRAKLTAKLERGVLSGCTEMAQIKGRAVRQRKVFLSHPFFPG
jgi:hypothetical protein